MDSIGALRSELRHFWARADDIEVAPVLKKLTAAQIAAFYEAEWDNLAPSDKFELRDLLRRKDAVTHRFWSMNWWSHMAAVFLAPSKSFDVLKFILVEGPTWEVKFAPARKRFAQEGETAHANWRRAVALDPSLDAALRLADETDPDKIIMADMGTAPRRRLE